MSATATEVSRGTKAVDRKATAETILRELEEIATRAHASESAKGPISLGGLRLKLDPASEQKRYVESVKSDPKTEIGNLTVNLAMKCTSATTFYFSQFGMHFNSTIFFMLACQGDLYYPIEFVNYFKSMILPEIIAILKGKSPNSYPIGCQAILEICSNFESVNARGVAPVVIGLDRAAESITRIIARLRELHAPFDANAAVAFSDQGRAAAAGAAVVVAGAVAAAPAAAAAAPVVDAPRAGSTPKG